MSQAALTSPLADLSRNTRLPLLLTLFDNLSRLDDPREVLTLFIDAMRDAYGSRGLIWVTTEGCEPGEYRVARLLTAEASPQPLPEEFIDGDAPRCFTGGFLGEIIADPSPKLVPRMRVASDPVMSGRLAEYRSMIAAPIFAHGALTEWVMVLDPQPDYFNETSLEDLLVRANLVGVTRQNLRTSQRLREATERIHFEMDRIAMIQRALLPDVLPEVPGLAMAASYQTYDRAGGDMYDVAALVPGECGISAGTSCRWAILIADVSGHGPSAAVVMAMMHAILRAYPHEPKGPGEVLTHLNRHLYSKRIEAGFVTAFLAIYDPADRGFTYARAGHNPPLVKALGYGSKIRPLDIVGSLPLGILAHVDYDDAKIQLDSGETLLLYTDGITEAAGPNGKMFGVEGLERALANCAGDPDCVIASVNAVLRKHEAGTRPKDDQTMLAIQVKS